MGDAWRWFGNAGHLIVGNMCRFHLCTDVGEHIVSTVGEYFPKDAEKMQTIGAGATSFFETYVFKHIGEPCSCGCGMPEVEDWGEVDGVRHATRKEANEGHLQMCNKFQSSTPTMKSDGK